MREKKRRIQPFSRECGESGVFRESGDTLGAETLSYPVPDRVQARMRKKTARARVTDSFAFSPSSVLELCAIEPCCKLSCAGL